MPSGEEAVDAPRWPAEAGAVDEAAARLREAIEALESVVRDRSLMGALSAQERTRLLSAAGDVFNPDVVARRRWSKTLRRQEKTAQVRRDQTLLAGSGLRMLRERPVFTTPNVFPPSGFEQSEAEDPGFREVSEPQHCYVCKLRYVEIHHFYDQLCHSCGDLNYA